MSSKLLIGLVIVVVIVLVLVLGGGSKTSEENGTMMEKMEVNLLALSDSGETGTATLTEVNGKVVVTINLGGAPATAQPAHIHLGACPNPGAVEYQLTPVTNGNSESTVQASLADLKSKLPLAVNVHKSADDIGTYVACGDITLDALMEK